MGDTALVRELDGTPHTVLLAVVSQSEDIALLKLLTPLTSYFQISEISELALMLEGYGCSEDHDTPYQRSAIMRTSKGNESYISGCVCFGDSGGPVLNDLGELVGLMIRTYDEEPYRGQYAVMVQVKPFVESLPPFFIPD